MPMMRFDRIDVDLMERTISVMTQELDFLRCLQHENLVQYLGLIRQDDTLNILQEFISGRTLESLYKQFSQG